MSALREAAQQALEALEMSRRFVYADNRPQCDEAIAALRAALAQQDEPVARECSDPMCACRGGPCAECEEGRREKEIEDLRSSLYFYQRRCEALQSWQSKMRDPERTIVCDILANGKTLDPAFAGDRYTAPPQQAEPVQEPVAYIHRQGNHWEVSERFLLDDEKARGWTEEPLYTAPPRCPNCASLEAQNTELDRRLAEMEQAYENGYKAGVAAEREECAKVCDFHVARLSAIDEPRPALAVGICAAAIRARGNT